jgi:hypothetical protein
MNRIHRERCGSFVTASYGLSKTRREQKIATPHMIDM